MHTITRLPLLPAMGTGDLEWSGSLLYTIESGIPVITATEADGYLVDGSILWFDLVTGVRYGFGFHAGKAVVY